jgi:hypothetical protein
MLGETCQLRFTAAAACLLLLAIGGCQRSTSPQELLTSLRAQVEADDREYNRLMNSYGAPKMTPDGSAYTMTRNLREVAVPWDQVKIEETGGRTTTHRVVVPKIIRTSVKSGNTAEACATAQERELTPQNIEVTYEYNTLQKAWAAVR